MTYLSQPDISTGLPEKPDLSNIMENIGNNSKMNSFPDTDRKPPMSSKHVTNQTDMPPRRERHFTLNIEAFLNKSMLYMRKNLQRGFMGLYDIVKVVDTICNITG